MTEELRGYVDVWWGAVDDFTTLLEELAPEEWSAATDLPGWDVKAVAAHVAHLECLTDGGRHDDVEIGEPAHVTGTMGQFTEQGVVARRDHSADELITEIRSHSTRRHTALLDDLPADPDAPAPGVFGAIGWTQRTLLRNRPLDVWMHGQDVRRAVRRPGDVDTPAARHTADYLLESLGVVVAKRATAPAGTTVVLDVDGHDPAAVEVGVDGRARPIAPPETPTVRIGLDRESYLLLAGGRRPPDPDRLRVTGDADLAARILDQMGVTP